MDTELAPLPLIPLVSRLFEYALQHHTITGITEKDLHDIQRAVEGGHQPVMSARGQISSDRYEFGDIYLYVHNDFASLSKGEVLICASLKKELVYIRAPKKHELCDVVIDSVIHSEPF